MATCRNCGEKYSGRICPRCGWRANPRVRANASDKEVNYWKKVYGQVEKEHDREPSY